VSARTAALDSVYLAAALMRARRTAPDPADPLTLEPLLGGRTGAEVVKLGCGAKSYVVKTVPRVNWRGAGSGCPEGGEPRLWLSGVTAHLPPSVRWPVLDVSLDAKSDCYRILMEDVSAGIRARGRFTRADSRQLLLALARMHALGYEQAWLERAPLPNVVGTARLFAEPLLRSAGAPSCSEPWVAEVLRDFPVIGACVPGFLELLGPRLSDAYLALVADDSWRSRLRAAPATLLHGDLRRANIAFEAGVVALIDWELAAVGPPASDIQWHVFLHDWAYPPDGTVDADRGDALRDFYLHALEQALGRRIDRAAFVDTWALAWIKVVVSIGYVLYDALEPHASLPGARARFHELAARAVRRALDAREALG
jgi:hypothetical protein